MNANTLKHMQYFVGKVCSIISSSMNRAFNEQISREHFVVRVAEVTADGIWGTHPYNQEMISFFALPHIISIHQEVELDPSNPEHAEMIKEYEKKTGKKAKSDLTKAAPKKAEALPIIEESPAFEVGNSSNAGDSTFVDITSLEKLAEQTKRSFDAYDAYGRSAKK